LSALIPVLRSLLLGLELALSELADLRILGDLGLGLVGALVSGVIRLDAGGVLLVELVGRQRRDDLDFLDLRLVKARGDRQTNRLGGLRQLLILFLELVNNPLRELLDLLVLRLLHDLPGELDLGAVVEHRCQEEGLVGRGLWVLGDLIDDLLDLRIVRLGALITSLGSGLSTTLHSALSATLGTALSAALRSGAGLVVRVLGENGASEEKAGGGCSGGQRERFVA
jgi:hypothetical protein